MERIERVPVILLDTVLVVLLISLVVTVGGGVTISVGFIDIYLVDPDRPLFWLLVLLYIRGRFFRERSFLVGGGLTMGETFIGGRVLFVFLISLSAAFVMRDLGGGSLKDWDEAIYATVSRNMVRQSQWLSPVFNGADFFDKPPLHFMQTAVLSLLFGMSELTARLVSAMYGVLCLILVYISGERFIGRYAGALACLILVSLPHFMFMSRLGMLDTAMSFYTLLSLTAFWAARQDRRFLVLLGMSLGLGIMTKSAAGVVPLVIIVSYCIMNRQLGFVRSIYALWGSLLALILIVPWHLYMLIKHGESFLNTYFLTHIFQRMTTIYGSEWYPWNWYTCVLACEMDFWFSVLLVFLVMTVFTYRRSGPSTFIGFLLFSGTLFVIIISMSQTKHPWYITPLYPLITLCLSSFLLTIIKSRYHKALLLFPLAIMYTWLSFTPGNFFNDFSPDQKDIGLKIRELVPEKRPVYTCHRIINALHYYGERTFVIYSDQETLLSALHDPGRMDDFYVLINKSSSTQKKVKTPGRVIAGNSRFTLVKCPTGVPHPH